MKNLKTIMLALMTMALVLALAACQSDKPTNTGNDKKPATDGEKAEAVTLRFSWWGSEARHTAMLEAIDLYMAQNKHVTIEPEYSGFDGYYQKLVTQLAGATAPDLTPLSFDWINEIAIRGDLVHDLSDFKNVINLDAFDQDLMDKYMVINGKLVGLPMGVNGMAIMYNAAFLEKYDVDVNTSWDWETIHTIGKQIHEQDADAYLFGLIDSGIYRQFLMPYVSQLSGKAFIQDDFTPGFDEAQLTEAFTYYQSLLNDGVVEPVQESKLYKGAEDNPRWLNGQIGMTVSLASTIPAFANGPEVSIAQYPVPADAVSSGIMVNPANPLAITRSSKHPEEAAKFASWLLTSTEAAEILKDVYSVPAVPENMQLLKDKAYIDGKIVAAVETALANPGEPVNGNSSSSEVQQLANDYLDQVAFGRLTPEAAAKEFMERLNDKLADMKAAVTN